MALFKHCRCKIYYVGGVATNFNGYQRATDDIDVWIEDTVENRDRYRQAFENYSSENYPQLLTLQIIPGWTYFHLNNGYRLDLMVQMKGLESFSFDECLQMANRARIDDVVVPFLQINQLIANKKAVNRPKDQVDVIYLERIKKLTDDSQ